MLIPLVVLSAQTVMKSWRLILSHSPITIPFLAFSCKKGSWGGRFLDHYCCIFLQHNSIPAIHKCKTPSQITILVQP